MRIVKQISALLTIVYVCIDPGYAETNDCGLERFRCHNGECIAGVLLCDGKANCRDSSDETQAECMKPEILCPGYAFRCKYGACVNGDSVCNGIQDCVDNSDETQPQCRRTSENNTQTVRPALCRASQFMCDNGQCIQSIDVCDGTRDCADGSDETSARCESLTCPATVFRCTYGACIDGDLRCNGIVNCADGSDEDPRLCGGIGWPSPLPPVRPGTTSTTTEQSIQTPGTKTCKAPLQPENGHWKLHRSQCSNTAQDCDISEGVNLVLGSRLVYSCNPGYKIRDSSLQRIDVSCSFEGKWLNIPICTEVRCKALSTASINADCRYDGEWVSCDSPVLPRTRATLICRNSYQRESSLLSIQRDQVICKKNGQWEPEPIRCVPVCGVPPPNFIPQIIGGVLPNITEFPWHASLYRDVHEGKPKKFFCGASIIKENLLITAAHCIHDESTWQVIDPNKIYVATGNIFRDYESPSHNPVIVKKNQVKQIYIRCNYLGYLGNYNEDIAILELVEPFVLSATLVPVCIDLFGDKTVLEEGAEGKVAGFGRTGFGGDSASGILQALTVPYIPFNKCKSASQEANITLQFLTSDKFCAGYTNGSSVCEGDSGGGLIFKTNDLWYLRGIVSVSLGTTSHGGSAHCNNKLYSLYTQITNHINWIQNIIFMLEHNQSYTLCPN